MNSVLIIIIRKFQYAFKPGVMKLATASNILIIFILLLLGPSIAWSAEPVLDARRHHSDIAFYYQSDLPVDELRMFDAVVIDPTRASLPDAPLTPYTAWFARLDL